MAWAAADAAGWREVGIGGHRRCIPTRPFARRAEFKRNTDQGSRDSGWKSCVHTAFGHVFPANAFVLSHKR